MNFGPTTTVQFATEAEIQFIESVFLRTDIAQSFNATQQLQGQQNLGISNVASGGLTGQLWAGVTGSQAVWTGSPSVSGSLTAATSVTAGTFVNAGTFYELGGSSVLQLSGSYTELTSTDGAANLFLGISGNGIIYRGPSHTWQNQGGTIQNAVLTTVAASQFVVGNGSTANTIAIGAAATGVGTGIYSGGVDTNVAIGISTKGNSGTTFYTNAFNNVAFSVAGGSTSTVNYLQVQPNVTGGYPNVVATGSDTNVGMSFFSKGTANISFNAGSTADVAINGGGQNGLLVTNTGFIRLIGNSNPGAYNSLVASGDNTIIFSTGTTGNGVLTVAPWSASISGMRMLANGNVTFTGISGQAESLTVTTNSGNAINLAGEATGVAPAIYCTGVDTNIGLNISTKGNGGIGFQSNNFATPIFAIAGSTTAANYIQVGPNTTGNAPTIQPVGTDTNINLALLGKGSGIILLANNGTVSGSMAMQGNSSGIVTIQPQAAAGTWAFNLPTSAGSAGQVLTSQGGGSTAMTWSPSATTSGLEFVIDGGGATLVAATYGYLEVPFNCTITQSTLLANQSGSVVVDIYKCTYAQFDAGVTHPVAADKITASAPPTISSATKAQDATLTGWTTTLNQGDILGFVVTGTPTSIQRVTLSLRVNRT